ncbi:MAG: hypothetical protein IKY94_09775 [Lachnospiraceae bacterium]|nr:hypothetical protein [Lachnospiraceae bacterium]
MKNICRPFILYSDFLPPVKECREWKYLSFGYYDGVDVEENLFNDDKWDLNKLWDTISKRKKKLSGSYTEKIIFGFRTEEDDEKRDEEFWSTQKAFPFLFLVLLQNRDKGEKLISLWEKRKGLEAEIEKEGVKAISYLTLDNSDLLLVLGCKEYTVGAQLIDSFHTGRSVLNEYDWNLGYSYSIPSVRKEFLNKTESLNKIGGMVESAYIHTISKYPGSTEKIYKEIYEKVKKYNNGILKDVEKKAILGCNDDVIVLKNIPWSLFLSFYQDETGILNHSSLLYREGITGVTTIIGVREDERENINNTSLDSKNTLCAKLRKKCNEEQGNGEDSSRDVVKDKLLLLLNSLEKYENSLFPDYTFLSALGPIDMLIDLVDEVRERDEGTRYDEFYEFLAGFNMYAQTSVRTDRQFTEIPGFNVQMYETPVKINALYNAVVYDLKNALNQKDKNGLPEYEFLLCPGMVSNMSVKEIYADCIENRRLFIVNISDKQAYNPQLILTMLGHEVCHVVGRSMRGRKETRYALINEMLTTVFVQYLYWEALNYTKGKVLSIVPKEIWEQLWEAVRAEIDTRINQEKDNGNNRWLFSDNDYEMEERETWNKLLKNYLYHTRMLKLVLDDYMHDIINNKEYVSSVLNDCELKEFIETKMDELTQYSIWNKRELNITYMIDQVMYLFRECFADLGAVLLLNLSEEQYLESLACAAIEQGGNVDTLVEQQQEMMRATVVCACMMAENEEIKALWKQKKLYDISVKGGKLKNLAGVLVRSTTNYIAKYKRGEVENWTLKEVNKENEILYSTCSLKYVYDYLCECRKQFWVVQNKPGEITIQQSMQRIHEIVEIFKEDEMEKVIFHVQKYIDSYRNLLNTEIKKKYE